MTEERPHTHTQYQDRGADDVTRCHPAEHRYIADDDGSGFAVCARCGDVIDESEPL